VSGLYLSRGLYPEEYLRPTADYILEVQRPWGEIPWFPGGHTDPWDHVEAAMALSIAGEHEGAKRAYRWLADCQLGDGSWWRAYQDNQPQDPDRRETNYVAYIATGIWHHYLITGDRGFLEESYPFVRAAIDFVVRLQGVHGEIDWAVDTNGVPMGDALVTGCSSIFKSLECACHIASTLGEPMDNWVEARRRLGVALRTKPERFDRTWASKSRYAMDWFYPIITGWITGAEAKERIHRRWQEFVEPGLGCRCEIQEPWVTVAESCELTLALLAAGERAKAGEVFAWLTQWRAGNGAWWTGYQLVEDMLWPDEKPTWTAGAILLAADALTGHTAASNLFLAVQEPESQPDIRQARRTRL
jgi:hypothetical protein